MVVNIISSICVWAAILVLLIRLFNNSGIPIGGRLRAITADKSLKGGFEPSRKDTAAVFGCALLFRLIVFLISIVAIYIFKNSELSWQDLLNEYLKWDANNYQRIAIGGYTYHTEGGEFTTLAFFPLYPWIIRVVSLMLKNEIISGIIVSGLLYSGACCYLYRLVAIDYNQATAIRALVYISVFPHSLFLGVMMNESTLLFTMCATLYYIRKHNWKLVGVFGALAALSRLAGILLAIPAAVEWLEEYEILGKLKNKEIGDAWRLFYRKGLWIFLMLIGTGIYLFCNYKTTGEWFKFLEYQEKIWGQHNVYFGKGTQGIFDTFKAKDDYTKFAIWIPAVTSVVFTMTALLYGIRRNRNMYTALLIIYIIINTGLSWPISIARYMVCAVPAFVFMSDFSERHKWTEPLITASMAITFGVYLVAYFQWKQIL